MSTTIYMTLVIAVFFGLVAHSIHQDEKRKRTRRQRNVPFPVERRRNDRRKGGLFPYLGWMMRTMKARYIK